MLSGPEVATVHCVPAASSWGWRLRAGGSLLSRSEEEGMGHTALWTLMRSKLGLNWSIDNIVWPLPNFKRGHFYFVFKIFIDILKLYLSNCDGAGSVWCGTRVRQPRTVSAVTWLVSSWQFWTLVGSKGGWWTPPVVQCHYSMLPPHHPPPTVSLCPPE